VADSETKFIVVDVRNRMDRKSRKSDGSQITYFMRIQVFHARTTKDWMNPMYIRERETDFSCNYFPDSCTACGEKYKFKKKHKEKTSFKT